MTILERAANLNNTDLTLLAALVRENSNKDKRWIAFKDSGLKEKLENEYPITKADFLISDGLEATTRTFISASHGTSIDLDKFREALLNNIPDGAGFETNVSNRSEETIAKPNKAKGNLIQCTDCGKSVSKNALSCPNCGNPINAPTPKQNKNIMGNWCPHCGDRNSYKTREGLGCLIVGILFISIIGILFIPFIPKSWKCKSCGNVWK